MGPTRADKKISTAWFYSNNEQFTIIKQQVEERPKNHRYILPNIKIYMFWLCYFWSAQNGIWIPKATQRLTMEKKCVYRVRAPSTHAFNKLDVVCVCLWRCLNMRGFTKSNDIPTWMHKFQHFLCSTCALQTNTLIFKAVEWRYFIYKLLHIVSKLQ